MDAFFVRANSGAKSTQITGKEHSISRSMWQALTYGKFVFISVSINNRRWSDVVQDERNVAVQLFASVRAPRHELWPSFGKNFMQSAN